MKRTSWKNVTLALLAVTGLATVGMPYIPAVGSSHREAPITSSDPQIDTTDVYAFRSPDDPNTVTLIANWIPLQQPAAGPNFYRFADDASYKINIDNTGDARPDVVYEFRFNTIVRNPNTFLYNTGPVTSLMDTDLNVYQTYTVTRVLGTVSDAGSGKVNAKVVSEPLTHMAIVAPANVGPRSMPDYDSIANQAIQDIPASRGGGKVFAGPRDDPFFVDLGSAFDLLGLRPLNEFHAIPLPASSGVDGVAGYNVHTTALQVPISSLGATNGVVGIWATAERSSVRIQRDDGTIQNSGRRVQVSRLGMPLVNEVVIPLMDKDKFNASKPVNDAQFGSYVTNPEMTGLINALYPPVIDAPTSGRTDLVAVFLTGIPGLNQLPMVTPSEMIRLNTNIMPSSSPNRLGVVGGDNAGFPNGRRLIDDVVDIELRALECSYGVVGTVGPCDSATYNQFPNNAITDGLDANEKPFLTSFPYMASPYQGYEAMPPTGPMSAEKAAFGLGGLALGFGLIFTYGIRRRQERIALDDAGE